MMTIRVIATLAALLLACLPAQAQAPAPNQSLDQLLDRTGKNVARFLDELASVICSEEVSQEKLNLKGKPEERVASSFEYMLLVQTQKDEPVLYESRQAVREGHSKKNISLLVSNGFATQLLIFHPYYQPSFTFERLADITTNGKTYAQVRFEHVKGRPTPAALMVRGREYPISLAGVARIDPATGVVQHITTELGASMDDVGLKTMNTDVDYNLVGFTKESKSYWLPAQATIEVSTARQHWKNIHHFTGYRLFSVNVSEQVDVNKIKAKEQ